MIVKSKIASQILLRLPRLSFARGTRRRFHLRVWQTSLSARARSTVSSKRGDNFAIDGAEGTEERFSVGDFEGQIAGQSGKDKGRRYNATISSRPGGCAAETESGNGRGRNKGAGSCYHASAISKGPRSARRPTPLREHVQPRATIKSLLFWRHLESRNQNFPRAWPILLDSTISSFL